MNTPAASLRALLAGSIDYAGLFPPASLALEPSVANYAGYVRSVDEWMLGAFILPTGKFAEVATSLAQFDVEHRFRISALGAKTDTPEQFISAIETTAQSIREFEVQFGAIASVSQIEMPLATQPGASIADAYDALAGLNRPVFFEAPADEAERTIAGLAEHRRAGTPARLGFKLRTGGVVASAFPSSMQIARALVAAITHGVPIKFTAGLHHPIRLLHSSVQTKMHGFLNVLGAGVLAAEHKWDAVQTAGMLDDESAESFVFNDNRFSWREWTIATDRIAPQRELITSLGSCSFDEPREDLIALNLLPSAAG
ncbi:MAG: hypothetical protein M3032_07415 [Verrucomicrobiota bacterium]|nr:hypothetical protein [Verrucomicrobiota bacterium]